MSPEEKKALLAAVARMEEQVAFYDAIFDKLPTIKKGSAEWDAINAKIFQRRRGDRAKLPGALSLEDVAVFLLKWRRRQLRRDGLRYDDAMEKALAETASRFHVAPSTLEDWYKGKTRRNRKKRKLDS